MVSTASLLGAWRLRKVVENNPASSLVMSLGKALNGMPLSLCGPDTSEMPTLKRVRTSRPKYSDTIRFLVNGG